MGLFTSAKSREDSAARRWCRVCGRPVRSQVGEVCSRPDCHRRYLQRSGGGR
jgi:hypothetical protein